jgi:hypothetical protein
VMVIAEEQKSGVQLGTFCVILGDDLGMKA